jgi:hypothetical protein
VTEKIEFFSLSSFYSNTSAKIMGKGRDENNPLWQRANKVALRGWFDFLKVVHYFCKTSPHI